MPYRVTELHNIMPINNLASVRVHGILSHNAIAALPHADVSMQEIQDKRDKKTVPNGLALHDYANLYFSARNPMMFKRKDECLDLCVLRISIHVFELPNVVFTDQNAASAYARFYRVEDGIKDMKFDMIFADDWTHSGNQALYYEHKSTKCAEVLVPNVVETRLITGAYVYDTSVQSQVAGLWPELPTVVNKAIFFG